MNRAIEIPRKDVYSYLERGFKVRSAHWNKGIYIFLNTDGYIENDTGFIWPYSHQENLRNGRLEKDKDWFYLLSVPEKVKKEKEEYVYKRKCLLNWRM